MEKIKYIAFLAIIMILTFSSCTKYNYIDGGVANGIHDCTMWEYLTEDTPIAKYNWDSTRIMIEHAGLKSYFDGSREENITFFGINNHVIKRYILEHNARVDAGIDEGVKWGRVIDIPSDECARILSKLIVKERLMATDIPRGKRETEITELGMAYKESGGKDYKTLSDDLFIFTEQLPYNNVPNSGAISIYFISRAKSKVPNQEVMSSDIVTNTGIVQALGNTFNIINIQ